MKFIVPLVSVGLVCGVLVYALARKGDVKAGFKAPFIEFFLETRAPR